MSFIPVSEITGLLLAGGQGSRMGGVDKGLQVFRGRPLAAWTLERLAPQVSSVLISANRNLDHYAAFGGTVVKDELPDYAGPLAGLHAALGQTKTPWLATCPCDSPFLPPDLVAILAAALTESGAPLAVVRTPDGPQPVFMLCRRELRDSLGAFLAAGGRRIRSWQDAQGALQLDFDDSRPFANFNTLADLDLPSGFNPTSLSA